MLNVLFLDLLSEYMMMYFNFFNLKNDEIRISCVYEFYHCSIHFSKTILYQGYQESNCILFVSIITRLIYLYM